MIERKNYLKLFNELASDKEMIFLTGPRQVGKTTLSQQVAQKYSNYLYFNWDLLPNKKKLIENPLFFQEINRKDDSRPLITFDEIHKYKDWKNYLKGVYDQFKDDYQFLVTGSGRLDVYQKGGDSLAGRYFLFHMFPLTMTEIRKNQKSLTDFLNHPLKNFVVSNPTDSRQWLETLFYFGGFPEPFTKNKQTFLNRWTKNYFRQIIHEDIRNFADVKKIDTVEMLFSLLPSKVGSPLSLNNLAGDLQVAFDSVKSWIDLMESVYLVFRLSPWTKKISRSILREKKLYLYHSPLISDEGNRFENLIAIELIRAITYWNESGWGHYNLHYLRNKEKKEVDFVITDKNNPLLLIEAKLNDTNAAENLIYFQNILQVPAVQLVYKKDVYKRLKNNSNEILIISADQWLPSLP